LVNYSRELLYFTIEEWIWISQIWLQYDTMHYAQEGVFKSKFDWLFPVSSLCIMLYLSYYSMHGDSCI